MNRDTLSLLAFSLLAMAAINGSYQWLDSHQTLNSQQALNQAEKMVSILQTTHGQSLKLNAVIPPRTTNESWRFEYQNKNGKRVLIKVQENGQASIL
ncbi:hypothetical protein [Vampirovibrio sp.]|uniref:hypothetical protein n=1 Tax=Vampirovibrio sp. TaxID=2717857 RepID=UPI003593FA91